VTISGLARRDRKGFNLETHWDTGSITTISRKLIVHPPPTSPHHLYQPPSNNVLPPPPPPSPPLLPLHHHSPHTQIPPPLHQRPPPPNLLNLPPTPHRQNDHRRPPRRRARTRAHSLRQRHGPLRARDEPRTERQPPDELVEGGLFRAGGGVTGFGYGVGEGVSLARYYLLGVGIGKGG